MQYKKCSHYETCTNRPHDKICTIESQKVCPILNEE